jgi:hypothetical protein
MISQLKIFQPSQALNFRSSSKIYFDSDVRKDLGINETNEIAWQHLIQN